jgi:hypothetical protein
MTKAVNRFEPRVTSIRVIIGTPTLRNHYLLVSEYSPLKTSTPIFGPRRDESSLKMA